MTDIEYDAPHRTETQRTADDIKAAVTNLRRDWDHMIRPGESQAPGWRMKDGGNRGSRDGVIDDFGRLRFPQDQSPEVGQSKEETDATDADMRRIDKVISLRTHVATVLASWSRVIIDDRGITNGSTIPMGNNAPAMAVFIERHADWLSGHEAANDARDELTDLAHRCHLVAFPTRRESISIGRCPLEQPGEQDVLEVCGGDVRSRPAQEGEHDGQAWAACNRCGQVAVASWWEDRMFADPELRRWLTDADVVTFMHRTYGEVITQSTVRGWVRRRILSPSGETTDEGKRLFARDAVVVAVDFHKRREARA